MMTSNLAHFNVYSGLAFIAAAIIVTIGIAIFLRWRKSSQSRRMKDLNRFQKVRERTQRYHNQRKADYQRKNPNATEMLTPSRKTVAKPTKRARDDDRDDEDITEEIETRPFLNLRFSNSDAPGASSSSHSSSSSSDSPYSSDSSSSSGSDSD